MSIYSNYWSCGKFANWLRGTDKPDAETGKGWRLWNQAAKEKHPIRYWLAEEGLDYIQDFVYWPYNKFHNIRYYINNRWVTKSHALTANSRDIKPGQWQDVGYRFLPCLFNELVDFVEVEQAWHHVVWDDESRKKYCVPWWRTNFFKWRTWRCKEAGIAYLDWAASLKFDYQWMDETDPDFGKPTPQALAAQEIKELYLWWTETYRNRPDPYDISGWTALCDKERTNGDVMSIFDHDNETPEQRNVRDTSLKKLREIEQQYEQEEEDMLIRLIKIRKRLWT